LTHSGASVRAMQESDHDQWLVLWRAYQVFYKTSISDLISRESWRRMLDSEEPTFGAIAFDGDELLGFAHWILHRSNWALEDFCYLEDLYVGEESRGLGVGRLLIEHVFAESKKAGCSRVYWLTHETNKPAMLLYNQVANRSGFIHYEKII
jgi:GNAT superfamily N-acetyltransferase